MKTFITMSAGIALASAGLIPRQNAGSPMNLGAISAASAPSVTGPPVTAVSDTNPYDAASASSAGSAAASPTGSGSKVKRNLCWSRSTWTWGPCGYGTFTYTSPSWSASAALSTSTAASTCSSTSYTPYYPAVTTGTATQYRTPTVTSGSATACPTQPEAGTYCGFINPEDACAPQPDGYGPVPTPDTPSAFLSYALFAVDAYAAHVPQGYSQNFTDLNAAVSSPNYLALKTLQTYSTDECAAYCDCTETCSSFNLYIERDPSLNPAANCTNPPSMTSYKCTIFAGPISSADATNSGQYRDEFEVVITGSNAYNRLPTAPHLPSTSGWQSPSYCPGGAISAPSKQMGGAFFPGPFDPRVCASYAVAQTAENKASSQSGRAYESCSYFNAYAVTSNGSYAGLYCNLFTGAPGAGDGPSTGSYTGCQSGGIGYEVEWSFSYQITASSQNSVISRYIRSWWN